MASVEDVERGGPVEAQDFQPQSGHLQQGILAAQNDGGPVDGEAALLVDGD